MADLDILGGAGGHEGNLKFTEVAGDVSTTRISIMPYATDNSTINFDSYLNDAENAWVSSDAGSNFQLKKTGDKFAINYDSGVAVDSTITWNTAMTFDTSGKVGIGTTSPSALLHVKVASRATAYDADNAATWADSIVMNPSGADTSATGIAFYNNGTYHTNAASGIALVKHTASSDYGSDMAFIVRPQSAVAIEGMRLTSAGNVGIGTTSPTYALDIVPAQASAFRVKGGTNGADVNCQIYNTGTSSGDGSLLDISTVAGAGDPEIRWSVAGNENYTMGLDNSDADKLKISGGTSLGSSDYMTFYGNKVGIGTTSPSRNLTVSSSGQTDLAIIAGTSASAQLQFGDSGDDNIGQIEYNNTENSMSFFTNATERLFINNAGLVGIGSSPTNLTSEIVTITTPSSGGGQGIAFKRLDSNSDQQVGSISYANNSTDNLAKIYAKTDGANTSSRIVIQSNTGSGLVDTIVARSNGYVDFTGASDLRVTFGSQGTAGTNDSNWVRGDGTGMMYNAASRDHRWEIGGSEVMRIDSNKNVRIAEISKTHHGDYVGYYLPNGGLLTDEAAGAGKYVSLSHNAYINTSNQWAYNQTDECSLFQQGNGVFLFYNAASGSADAAISFTERMRVDANGRVGIGTSSPAQPLHVYGSAYSLRIQSSTGYGQMGSGNSSYFHNDTDRGANYWGVRCEASGGFHTYSDENLKKEITTITGALDSVIKMNGVTFKWKDAEKRGGGDTGKQFGVTAQNMLTVDAELPSLNVDPLAEAGNEETDDKFYTMDYSRLTPYLIESIKELKTELDAAKARIAELESS